MQISSFWNKVIECILPCWNTSDSSSMYTDNHIIYGSISPNIGGRRQSYYMARYYIWYK